MDESFNEKNALENGEKTRIARVSVTLPKFFRTRGFRSGLRIGIGVVAGLLIFQLGMYVGFRKADFAYDWGDNYQRVFGGPRDGLIRGFVGSDLTNGHGIAGTIAAIEKTDLIIKSADRLEKMITVNNRTSIIGGRSAIRITDLRVGDLVTIIGKPCDDGTIQAEIIRVFPAPPLPINLPMMNF